MASDKTSGRYGRARQRSTWRVVARMLIALAVLPVAGRAAAPPGRYAVANGQAYDTKTGLTWQQEMAPGAYTWAAAQAYCDGADMNGSADWRLPTTKELLTLVDDTRGNPAVDVTVFPNTSGNFWSSTPLAGSTDQAWDVYLDYGYPDISLPTSSSASVRCVR